MTRGGATTGRIKRALATERHQRTVHLLDVEAMRRVLSGSPAFLTEWERRAVIVLADCDGMDRELVAGGLDISRGSLDGLIDTNRRRASALTRDVQAAAMLRPADDLVEAVRVGDAGGVSAVLTGLDRQRLAALCVVLAAMVADAAEAVDEP